MWPGRLMWQFLDIGTVCSSRKPRGWGSGLGLEGELGWGPQTWGALFASLEAAAGVLHRGLRLGFPSGEPGIAVRSPG